MAVAFDARSEGSATAVTSITVSHTIAGSDRALYVGAVAEPGDLDLTTVSGTYDSAALTVKFTDSTVTNRGARVFRRLAPNTGTHDIILSWSGNHNIAMVAGSFTGVDQGSPDDAQTVTDGSGGGTSSSVSGISSAAGNMTVDILVSSFGITNIAADGGQTEINQITGGGGSLINAIAMSYESGAGSVTMGWSWTGAVTYMQAAWDVNAAATTRKIIFGPKP